MAMPLTFKDFDPRRSKQNSSYISRLIWQNTGAMCLLGLLVLPVIVGLAVGYLIVLLGVTTYKRVNGQKARDDAHKEAYQKIKVVLGEEVVDSSFPNTVALNIQDDGMRKMSSTPQKYYYHRLVNQNGDVDNGYVKTYAQIENLDSADDTQACSPTSEYPDNEGSDSSTHASIEDNADKTDDEKKEKRRENRQRRASAHSNKTKIVSNSPEKMNSSEDKLVTIEIENDKLTSSETQGGTLGRLRFALHYNVAKNELQVNIIKAAGLIIQDNKEGINPYIKICLLPQQFCWQRTKIVEGSPDPVFNETFVISGFSKDRIQDYTLRFCVVNYHDHFKERYADDAIGDIYFPLSELKIDEDRPLFSLTKWMDLQPLINSTLDAEDRGEVCLSLCFRPISGRLIVTVTKLRGLPKAPLDRTDPYIKLSLYCDGVRLAKANTRVKRKTLNPVYNEKFNFNVSADQISLTTVALKIVNHYDVTLGGTSGGSLGLVLLGFNSEGSGQEQWNSMLESPSRHIEKWHKIHTDDFI